MGLILDTCILIESERRGEGVEDILRRVRAVHGEIDIALAAVSAVELTHGIYRARTDAAGTQRRVFVEGVFHDLIVHPLTLEIAQLAGRIEGEQAARGAAIGARAHPSVGKEISAHCNSVRLPAKTSPSGSHRVR